MDYIELNCTIEPLEPGREIIISYLAELGYESFVDNDTGFQAYIPEINYSDESVQSLKNEFSKTIDFKYSSKLVKDQNWNEVWESNFPFVLIQDKCLIRAPFHKSIEGIQYDLIIEPKMSFGTAHHETTYMMIEFILDTEFRDLNVLDMGCGTGVLAILAAKKGANQITAIDNDEWAYNNTLENIHRNSVQFAKVLLGDVSLLIEDEQYDVIIANINRNILTKDIPNYAKSLNKGGKLFLSGFYKEDFQIIDEVAKFNGLKFNQLKERNNWAALEYIK